MEHIIPAEFNGTPLSIIDRDGQKWLTSEEIGRCLGYNEANVGQGIRNLYNRHLDEFGAQDSRQIDLICRDGKPRLTRIFSDKGCIKLGFFANTPRAKDFRNWASSVLASQPAPVAQPAAADLNLAREIGSLRDMVATQNQAILALYQQVDGARRGHIRALGKLLTLQERQSKLLAGQEKREARETIIRLEAEGVPRDIIAQRTGRTLNHIRQVVFKARHEGLLPDTQGNLALGDAA